MYSRFSAAVRFSEPPLGTRFRALVGQPCAPTPQSWLRIPGVDRQPGRLHPRRRLHTSQPRRGSADARYHESLNLPTEPLLLVPKLGTDRLPGTQSGKTIGL